jgi:hypothetical protein
MDGRTFAKVTKDCKIQDKKLTATDVDIIFRKVKATGRMNFAEFQQALTLCATKKGTDVEELAGKITGAGGPTYAGTKAEANKFHDDKSLYTGVYAQGGPTNVDQVHPVASFGSASTNEEEKVAPKKSKQTAVNTNQPAGSLEEVFMGLSSGAADMDGKTFAKMAKDCKILDKNLTATDIDLIFAKVKDKTARKITYPQFAAAIELCASKKKVTNDELVERICAVGGPVFTGTKADKVKFHDDKSLYTGVYAAGGPSTVDAGNGMISDISQLCDRTGADVRGVKK